MSVYGTVMAAAPREAFLGGSSGGFGRSPALVSARPSAARRISLPALGLPFPREFLLPVRAACRVPPRVMTLRPWFRNINRMPFAYAFRPRLRTD